MKFLRKIMSYYNYFCIYIWIKSMISLEEFRLEMEKLVYKMDDKL